MTSTSQTAGQRVSISSVETDVEVATNDGGCCRSKCSVAKRALCATDNQCSSVGRTQSSDTSVGGESAVVSQVARDVAGQRPMNQRGDLVVDALSHWKPVQLAKHR